MTLCYLTNIWGHLQTEVCKELRKLLGDGFRMILTQPLNHEYSLERIRMGWQLEPPRGIDWVIGPPKVSGDLTKDPRYCQWIENADVLVFSNYGRELRPAFWKRINAGKLTFKMSETIFKHKLRVRDFLSYTFLRRCIGLHYLLNRPNVHFLTISHWCARDLAFLHTCKGKTWQWGYLTRMSSECPPSRENGKLRIVWCGRMLQWKRVDLLIKAVAILPDDVKSMCDITLIGNGPEESNLKKLAQDNGLMGFITFVPFMKHEDVMIVLNKSHVYSFSSNVGEGWGAALVEAMNCGCVPIANEAAGVTLEVVQDGENGFVYKDGDFPSLAEKIEWCAKNFDRLHIMATKAWASVVNGLSPSLGAERLIGLSTNLIDGCGGGYSNGLCSLKW